MKNINKLIFTSLLVLLCQYPLFAVTYTFLGTTDSQWTTPANWDTYPGLTIGAGDEAIIAAACMIAGTTVTNNGTITVNATFTFIVDYILTNNSSVVVNGTLATGSTIDNENGATITINSSGLLQTSGSNFRNKLGGTVDNSGTIQNNLLYNNFGTTNNKSGGLITNVATINNESGGIINNESGANINSNNFNNKTGSTFNNSSTFTTIGGGTFTNDDTVNLLTGSTFTNNSIFNNNDTFAGVGTLVQANTFNNNAGSKVVPAGNPTAGTLAITGNMNFGSADIEADIAGDAPSHDLITVSGTATIGAATELSLNFTYAPVAYQVYDIITGNTVSGNFTPANVSSSGMAVTDLTTINNTTSLRVTVGTVPASDVPTLSQWGLIILALLFMTMGTLYWVHPYFRKS
ncbi:MAG: IPTL-CTERM sorting domain-containing protein, partial [Chitinophagales bacterium]